MIRRFSSVSRIRKLLLWIGNYPAINELRCHEDLSPAILGKVTYFGKVLYCLATG